MQSSATVMSKKQYFKANAVVFKNLSPVEKDLRYRKYLRKHNRAPRSKPLTIPNSRPRKRPIPRSARFNDSMRSKMSLSQCTLSYAVASMAPFSEMAELPCIPDEICAPSYKFAVTGNGQFTIGTTGTGFIACNPFLLIANDWGSSATNIDYPILVTTATYPYTDRFQALATDITAGYLEGLNSSSLYTGATINEGEMRLVAWGVEIFYTGIVLNQSGAVTSLQYDGLNDFPDAITITQIRNNPRSITCTVSKDDRCHLNYMPTSQAVLSYQNITNYIPTALNVKHYYPELIIVNGAAPGTTFQFRMKAYYEVQLPGMMTSPSHSDPIGFAALQSARTTVLNTGKPEDDLKSVLKKTLINIGTNISGLAPSAGTALGAVFGNPTAGTIAGNAVSGLLNSILSGVSQTI
jgi:hypothetical protein